MTRSVGRRIDDVRRLLVAARVVYEDRARIASRIGLSTGLPLEGVEVGFASLERDASDADLSALVAAAGDCDRAHVILSANVFVAPLRALAIARAGADYVTVRPSPRDPVLASVLVDAAQDRSIVVVRERDVASVQADQIHVYGREHTIAAVRARARDGVIVRGHGPGMGVALVTPKIGADSAAAAIAEDVVPFDQRGCLSPRLVLVEGSEENARSFVRALDEHLRRWGRQVPRGALSEDERADALRWREAMAFAGQLWRGDHHAVALVPAGAPLAIPPAGRHVCVVPQPTLGAMAEYLAPVAPWVVAVGADDPARAAPIAPSHARLSLLGRMQRPALDGPVDRRAATLTPRSCRG
jgi:hypothetical protein